MMFIILTLKNTWNNSQIAYVLHQEKQILIIVDAILVHIGRSIQFLRLETQ